MSRPSYAVPAALAYRVASAPPQPALQELGGPTMGTRWSVKYWFATARPTPPRAALRAAVEAALAQVVAQMSPWEPDSDLSRYNRAAPGTWQTLPEPFFTVLRCALELARDSDGAYDPSVAPAVDLWGFGPAPARGDVPAAAALAAARARIGWRRSVIDAASRRVRQPGGCALDLSGIAKGHAVDAVVRALRALGCEHALVEVGGELYGLGQRPDGRPWQVAVKLPDVADGAGPVLALRGRAIATSGDDFRRYRADGAEYSHTIDPRSGWPVRNGLASVSVVHAECMRADALATALTVLGPEAGWAHAERHGLAALFLRRGADGLEARLTGPFSELLV